MVRAALAATLTAFVFAASADAATYGTTVSPNPFSYPASQQLVYRLQVTTGAAPERLWVSSDGGPSFPGGGKFAKLEPMTLEGPGTVVDRSGSQLFIDRFCSPAFPDTHGNASFLFTPMLTVEIPANSTSAIALPARPYLNAPFPGMDLAVEFKVGRTPLSAQVVRSPSPVNGGRRGLPISLRTDPQGGFGACLFPLGAPPPSVALGKDVLVSGKTDPALAGQLMTIRAAEVLSGRLNESDPSDLANVRIGADGAFGYRWRPAVLGDYAVGALYRSQSPGLADDFSEARNLRIAPPRGGLRPVSITAAPRVRCRGRRCVIVVRGSVRRPRAAGAAGCTGKVRLRVAVGKRRLLSTRFRIRRTCRYRARRRFMLRSPRARTVTARASYLGDRVLQRRRGRAVRVKIHR